MAVHQAQHTNDAKDIVRQRRQLKPPSRAANAVSHVLQRAEASSGLVTPGQVRMLQRAYGNRAVEPLLAPASTRVPIQAKLTVGPVGDSYEQEADRVAGQVLRMPQPVVPQPAQGQPEQQVQRQSLAASIMPLVQRQEEEELQMTPQDAIQRQEEEELQMTPQAAIQRQEEEELQMTPQGAIQRQEEEELQMTPQAAIQRQEEEELQMTPQAALQRQEEEELQMTPQAAIQRQEEEELQMTPQAAIQRQEEEELQMTPQVAIQRQADGGSFEAGSDLEDRLAKSRGGGQPLPEATRTYMEPRFGADFGHVRVHTDPGAAQLNRQIGAQAFTHGSDIYFGAGKYSPATEGGKHLLAHELTHTVQQGGSQKASGASPQRRDKDQ